MIVPDSVSAAEVLAVVRRAGGPLLSGAEVFDVYRDPERIGAGQCLTRAAPALPGPPTARSPTRRSPPGGARSPPRWPTQLQGRVRDS